MSSRRAALRFAIKDLHLRTSNSDAATAFLVAALCHSNDGESRGSPAGRAGMDVRSQARWLPRPPAQARRPRANSLAEGEAAVLLRGGGRCESVERKKRRPRWRNRRRRSPWTSLLPGASTPRRPSAARGGVLRIRRAASERQRPDEAAARHPALAPLGDRGRFGSAGLPGAARHGAAGDRRRPAARPRRGHRETERLAL